ncbi:MAG: hypothetical protein F6J87_28325 [Spirulina sp. SIO3F2]|nr:hypothetical protein [Spirulina sp. SIO3F2]
MMQLDYIHSYDMERHFAALLSRNPGKSATIAEIWDALEPYIKAEFCHAGREALENLHAQGEIEPDGDRLDAYRSMAGGE